MHFFNHCLQIDYLNKRSISKITDDRVVVTGKVPVSPSCYSHHSNEKLSHFSPSTNDSAGVSEDSALRSANSSQDYAGNAAVCHNEAQDCYDSPSSTLFTCRENDKITTSCSTDCQVLETNDVPDISKGEATGVIDSSVKCSQLELNFSPRSVGLASLDFQISDCSAEQWIQFIKTAPQFKNEEIQCIKQRVQLMIDDIEFLFQRLLLFKCCSLVKEQNQVIQAVAERAEKQNDQLEEIHLILQAFRSGPLYQRIVKTILAYENIMEQLDLSQHSIESHTSRTENFNSFNENSFRLDPFLSDIRSSSRELSSSPLQSHSGSKRFFSLRQRTKCPKKPAGRHCSPQRPHRVWGRTDKAMNLNYSHHVNPDGSLCVRVHAELEANLIVMAAIFSETSKYSEWVPFCKAADSVHRFSNGQTILRQLSVYPWPIQQRETYSFCFAVDALEESGSVLLISESMPATCTSYLGIDIPPATEECHRMSNSTYLFVLTPEPHAPKTILEMYAVIDVQVNLLRSLILPMLQPIITRAVQTIVNKIDYIAMNFEALGYKKVIDEHPELYSGLKRVALNYNSNLQILSKNVISV